MLRGVSNEMEPATPSMNDEIETLSRKTAVAALLATPAPSARSLIPHQYLWNCFPDYVWSQRARDTSSWVWNLGYDVQDSYGSRRWVCKRCIQNKSSRPRSFAEKGIRNANAYLFKDHGYALLEIMARLGGQRISTSVHSTRFDPQLINFTGEHR